MCGCEDCIHGRIHAHAQGVETGQPLSLEVSSARGGLLVLLVSVVVLRRQSSMIVIQETPNKVVAQPPEMSTITRCHSYMLVIR